MSEPENVGGNGTEICDLSDMERQGCNHCREKGLYIPPVKAAGAFRLSSELTLETDNDGTVWLGPDETFRRMGRDG